MLLTIPHLFSQWLVEAEAEDEDVDGEGDEAEAASGDDHRAVESLVTTSLFLYRIFSFPQETFSEFQCVFLYFPFLFCTLKCSL